MLVLDILIVPELILVQLDHVEDFLSLLELSSLLQILQP